MTPQEQEMLDGLIGRVQSAQLTSKDADADRRIHDALGSDPNALYILCQTVLLQGYALEQAQKQLAVLKEQSTRSQQQPPPHEPTFLEKIFGRSDPDQTPSSSRPLNTPGTGQPGYGAPVYDAPSQTGQVQYGQPGYTRPGYGQQPPAGYPPGTYPAQPGYGTPYAPYNAGAPGGFGGGGFLQGALQTAAGVALGEMAFQSVEGLFRGFGHAAGYGSDRAVGFGDVSSGNSGDYGQGGGFFSREQAENGSNDQLSPDIEDRRGDTGSSFADSGNASNAFAGNDDSATDTGYDTDDSLTEADGSDFTDSNFGGDSDSDFGSDFDGFDDGGGSDDGGSFSDNS